MIGFAPCPVPAARERLLGSLLNYLNCQTQALGGGGYQALAAPGSEFSTVLGGLLVLFVALFGYRLLFGHAPGVRDGVMTLAKIGIVLGLATSWPAYRVLAYDVVLKAPAEMAAAVGAPAVLPGAGGGLIGRLDGLDDAFITLAIAEQTGPTVIASPPGTPPPTPFDAYALGGARMVYLTAAAAALGSVWLIAGLLLALGPLFIAFLLFEGTRGLFEGWVRALVGSALGSFGGGLALGIELAFMEPRLAELVARRGAGEGLTGAGVELLVIALVFAFALVAILAAATRVALGLRLPWWRIPAAAVLPVSATANPRSGRRPDERMRVEIDRSRAVAIADAVATAQRRETSVRAGGAGATPLRLPATLIRPGDPRGGTPVPLGQSFRRRTRGRVSAASGRRDAT